MRHFLGKLRFVHGRLWRQDAAYRFAALVGPAPLLGGILAAAIWGSFLRFEAATYRPPPWATRAPGAPEWVTSETSPIALTPTKPLPPIGPDGVPLGYNPGWNVVLAPIEVSPTLDVDVKRNFVGGFTTGGIGIDMDQILQKAPNRSVLVAIGASLFVARQPGTYAFSIRFDRPPASRANCLIRMGVGTRRINSNVAVNVVNQVAATYPVDWFSLQTGLYTIGWVFGCWNDKQSVGPGSVTVLVSRPGEAALRPALAEDFVR